MEEKEHHTENKTSSGLLPFIPLAVIIVSIFILMQWKSPPVINDESIALKNNQIAPDFTLPGLDGKSVSLGDYRGKVVLVNIWATWCPPCIAEIPSLEKLYNKFKDTDFEILAVSVDENGESVIAPFIKKHNMSFPVLVDPYGSIMQLYGTIGVPETFVIRKDGTIDGKIEGAIDWMSPRVIEFIEGLIDNPLPDHN